MARALCTRLETGAASILVLADWRGHKVDLLPGMLVRMEVMEQLVEKEWNVVRVVPMINWSDTLCTQYLQRFPHSCLWRSSMSPEANTAACIIAKNLIVAQLL